MMSSDKQQSRDYLFDNYKVLLIALVVMGHFIELSYRNNDFLYTVKWLIVSFHMPAFIFISGYFSKRDLPLKTLIQKLLIPYLVYELLYYALYTFIIEKPTELYLLYPKFSLWYIQALFFWRLLTPVIRRIPGYMICHSRTSRWLFRHAGQPVKYSKNVGFLSVLPCRNPF